MTALKPSDFSEFFHAVHDYEPFPWQVRLAARVCGTPDAPGSWPRYIALPTAAGKTACIDIALFALACQAALAPEDRTAPRRIFFVVDRRVVVDQAFDHAKNVLAKKLFEPKERILQRVAESLHRVGADQRSPLDVYALRGGMYRESAWVRSPFQPTVITSTVDQVGSRLLFRGYGVSDQSMPLHAALVGNDSLILLDEAHCAQPFDQTMSLVLKYREWTQRPEDRLRLPFHFVTMTATPGTHVPVTDVERLGADDRAHPVLRERIAASKPARLVVAFKAKGAKWREELVTELVEQARRLQAEDVRAIGVIVNRVATARDVAATLRSEVGDRAEVVLLTGRMRPVDRDAIMKSIEPLLSKNAKSEGPNIKPIFVVATQTIEVGADLDFHALVTECASLDALRQRFGRLNRVAARDKADAVIIVRADQAEPSPDAADIDPVYGNSLAKTWKWLNEHGSDVPSDPANSRPGHAESPARTARRKGKQSDSSAPASFTKRIDFGVDAMEKHTDRITPGQISELNAPAPDAAVLLPAHLDMWCQTSPRPVPDPDPSCFLHGPQRGEPEVQVVFRSDLGDDVDKWAEIVSLCPPSSSEALSVRLRDFNRWLRNEIPDQALSDVEGQLAEESSGPDKEGTSRTLSPRCALRWRGPDSAETSVIGGDGRVTPNDTYIVSISTDDQSAAAAILGDFPADDEGAPLITDAGDQAYQRSRDKAVLRLRRNLYPQLDGAWDTTDFSSLDDDEIEMRIDGALDALAAHRTPSVQRAAKELRVKRNRTIEFHPLGGIVLIGKRRLHQFDPTFVEPEDSWESSSDRPYPLTDHCRDVAAVARSSAEHCGLAAFAEAVERAGLLHDAGKADPRFQAWLHGGNARRAEACRTLYAKSVVPFISLGDFIMSRDRAGYPAGSRHELASVRLAERQGALPADLSDTQRDLILHLIASHHGHCRPFAPVIEDLAPVPFTYQHNDRPLRFDPDSSISGHGLERLDSGVAERFWTLTRRYGWWGLPYLEALLRLADWACGEPRESPDSADQSALLNDRTSVAAVAKEMAE